MYGEIKRERVLITVKTYPHPSSKHREVVCTAGVTEDGRWIRLYPIDFRMLPPEKRFSKYQWIEVALDPFGQSGDKRPESRRPHLDTLEVCGEPISTQDEWRERRMFIDTLPIGTIAEWEQHYENGIASLGVVKPKRVLNVEIKETTADWTRDFVKQIDMFAPEMPELRKIPYDFRYVFLCEGRDEPYTRLVTDWEVGALYLNEEKRLKDQRRAAESVRNKLLNDVFSEDKESSFFVGTVYPHNAWIIVGLFYPPRKRQTFLEFETGV